MVAACDHLGSVGAGSLGTSAVVPLPDLILPALAEELTRAVFDDRRIRELLVSHGADPARVDALLDDGYSVHQPLDLSEQVGVPADEIEAELGRWAELALSEVEDDLNRDVAEEAPVGMTARVDLSAIDGLGLPMPRGRSLAEAWSEHLREQYFELRLHVVVDSLERVDLLRRTRISAASLRRHLFSLEIMGLTLRSERLEPADGGPGKAASPGEGDCGIERSPLDWLPRIDVRLDGVNAPEGAETGLRVQHWLDEPGRVGCSIELPVDPAVDALDHLVEGFVFDLEVVMTTPSRTSRLDGDVHLRVFTAPGGLVESIREVLSLFAPP